MKKSRRATAMPKRSLVKIPLVCFLHLVLTAKPYLILRVPAGAGAAVVHGAERYPGDQVVNFGNFLMAITVIITCIETASLNIG